MTRPLHWQSFLYASIILFIGLFSIRSDITHLDWVNALSNEGSPAPERDPNSVTGYALGQRHFLGFHNRGETYRWIAYAQELADQGLFSENAHTSDNTPEGRHQLLPRIYALWLLGIAWAISLFSSLPLPIAIESAALWEPIVTHAIVLASVSIFLWIRFPKPFAVAGALGFALFPALSAQFIPGTLGPETWALFLAAFAIARTLPTNTSSSPVTLPISSAISAALSLSLQPSTGAPAILLITIMTGVSILRTQIKTNPLRWATWGAILSLASFFLDRDPFETSFGELRYNHPLYALAWLGLGFALLAIQHLRTHPAKKQKGILLAFASVASLSPLAYSQISNGFLGWAFSNASQRRITALDESLHFSNGFSWINQAGFVETALLLSPILAAIFVSFLSIRRENRSSQPIIFLVLFVAGLGFAFFKIRWGLVLCLLAIPVLCQLILIATTPLAKRIAISTTALFFFALFAWSKSPSSAFAFPNADTPPAPSDLQALVYRHFSHWLAIHYPDRTTNLLAPPELSDSLIFHGGTQALMSTAWESYTGQVAASRVLSAPENSEADAVIQTHQVTHIALPSWDPVISALFVQQPKTEGDDTLYDRLQRWVVPLYLRPAPYQIPPLPGTEAEKFALFEVTLPQDEALSLSRLAEYFVEMERDEPASLAAQALRESFPDDPNAAIARAFVAANEKNQAAFASQLLSLSDDFRDGIVPVDWERRALRAIIFAFGRQNDAARAELLACAETATADALYQLTPLQTFHLRNFMRRYGIDFPDTSLRRLAILRSAEYSK